MARATDTEEQRGTSVSQGVRRYFCGRSNLLVDGAAYCGLAAPPMAPERPFARSEAARRGRTPLRAETADAGRDRTRPRVEQASSTATKLGLVQRGEVSTATKPRLVRSYPPLTDKTTSRAQHEAHFCHPCDPASERASEKREVHGLSSQVLLGRALTQLRMSRSSVTRTGSTPHEPQFCHPPGHIARPPQRTPPQRRPIAALLPAAQNVPPGRKSERDTNRRRISPDDASDASAQGSRCTSCGRSARTWAPTAATRRNPRSNTGKSCRKAPAGTWPVACPASRWRSRR